jgi:hypothetical protein
MNDAHNGWFMAGAQTMNKVFDNNRRLISQSGCQYYKYYDNEEFSFVFNSKKNKYCQIKGNPDQFPAECMHHLVEEW